MYNCYRNCCCQNKYNQEIIDNVCNIKGMKANYVNIPKYECNVNTNGNDCKCGFEEEENGFPDNPMLAQSYVPWQTMGKVFSPCCGLKLGTIFPELVSPYKPCQNMNEIEYLRRTNEIGEGCNKC